ncbi:MAG TPA: GAF domain-containing protein, partial [Pyrinomonadaceae bacterium]|nr:GAF domain-containing protein [Pyrinomonadaceae bacterium]
GQWTAYRTLAACPILCEGEMHGVITIYATILAKYEDEHTRLMEETAGLLGAALRVEAQEVKAVAATGIQPDLPDKVSTSNLLFSDSAISLLEVTLESELAH